MHPIFTLITVQVAQNVTVRHPWNMSEKQAGNLLTDCFVHILWADTGRSDSGRSPAKGAERPGAWSAEQLPQI